MKDEEKVFIVQTPSRQVSSFYRRFIDDAVRINGFDWLNIDKHCRGVTSVDGNVINVRFSGQPL